MAAWVPDMFFNFYLAKNHKITRTSTTTEGREKISLDFESIEFSKKFDACLTKFKNKQILLHKTYYRFLGATKQNGIACLKKLMGSMCTAWKHACMLDPFWCDHQVQL